MRWKVEVTQRRTWKSRQLDRSWTSQRTWTKTCTNTCYSREPNWSGFKDSWAAECSRTYYICHFVPDSEQIIDFAETSASNRSLVDLFFLVFQSGIFSFLLFSFTRKHNQQWVVQQLLLVFDFCTSATSATIYYIDKKMWKSVEMHQDKRLFQCGSQEAGLVTSGVTRRAGSSWWNLIFTPVSGQHADLENDEMWIVRIIYMYSTILLRNSLRLLSPQIANWTIASAN